MHKLRHRAWEETYLHSAGSKVSLDESIVALPKDDELGSPQAVTPRSGGAVASRLALAPLHPEIGVISVQYHRWTPLFMTQHYVMSYLSEHFPIQWIDRADPWRNFFNWTPADPPAPTPPPSIEVDRAPRRLARYYRPAWLANLTFDARIRRARQRLIERGCRKVILYLWRPEYARALKSAKFDLTCYHIDDDYTFSTVEVPVPEEERALIRSVDQVVIHSPGLMARMGSINPATAWVPQGVNYQEFATPVSAPADLEGIPRPILGYMGNLKRQLDWQLLGEVARRRPDWSFVFVGPTSAHDEAAAGIARLKALGNAWFTGGREVTELPAYVQQFDVCMMPYRVDSYTNSIYPLKLHDYLATGHPVVSTPIRTALDFRPTIEVAAGADEWIAAIERALSPKNRSAAVREARRNVAREFDWRRVIQRLADTLLTGLQHKTSDARSPGGR